MAPLCQARSPPGSSVSARVSGDGARFERLVTDVAGRTTRSLTKPILDVDLDLRDLVRPGDTVVWGQGAGAPLALIGALVAQRERIGPVRAFTVTSYDDAITPEHRDRIGMVSIGAVGTLDRLARAGALDIVPVSISALDGLFATGRLACDMVFVHVSPADADGWHRLGVAVDHLPACIDRARVVVAEVNDQLPVAAGPYRLHVSRITASVRTSRQPVQVPMANPSAEEVAVGARVAELVRDGATVQFGVGRLPDAIAVGLAGRRALRVHSGMVTDALVTLVEAGAIDTSRTSVVGGAIGTNPLYRLLAESPWLELHPYTTTHDPDVLASLDRLVAINSALEIDLTGQVAAERVGGVHVGAVGGQVDFLRGAARSRGGVPIIALVSATRAGRSRIVERLESGVVTTPRSDVGVVVTEHGVADLRGRTLGERGEALVAIAHPDARAELADAVSRL